MVVSENSSASHIRFIVQTKNGDKTKKEGEGEEGKSKGKSFIKSFVNKHKKPACRLNILLCLN